MRKNRRIKHKNNAETGCLGGRGSLRVGHVVIGAYPYTSGMYTLIMIYAHYILTIFVGECDTAGNWEMLIFPWTTACRMCVGMVGYGVLLTLGYPIPYEMFMMR